MLRVHLCRIVAGFKQAGKTYAEEMGQQGAKQAASTTMDGFKGMQEGGGPPSADQVKGNVQVRSCTYSFPVSVANASFSNRTGGKTSELNGSAVSSPTILVVWVLGRI